MATSWETLAGLGTVRAVDSDADALPSFLAAVAARVCGSDADVSTQFATRAGAPYLGTLEVAASRALQLAIAKGMTEPETVAWCRDQGVDATTAAALASAVQTHRAELLRAAARRASTIASGVLEDFDWSLRLVLASSTRAEMTEPVVVLTLTVRAGADDSPAEHIVELSRTDLEALVGDFDAIDKVLAKFAPITAAKA